MKSKLSALLISFVFGGIRLAASNLYICGDSIAADYSKRDPRPAFGWGEYLPELCKEDVKVNDLAIPGSSTKTWFDTGNWRQLCDRLQKGDFVFLALCFNDTDTTNPAAFSDPDTYGKNIEKMISDVRSAQATPLVLTPTVVYQAEPAKSARHQQYAAVAVQTAEKMHCEVIDLNRAFRAGIAASPEKFFVLKRTVFIPNWLDFDPVHLNRNGAELAAKCIAQTVKSEHLSAEVLFR